MYHSLVVFLPRLDLLASHLLEPSSTLYTHDHLQPTLLLLFDSSTASNANNFPAAPTESTSHELSDDENIQSSHEPFKEGLYHWLEVQGQMTQSPDFNFSSLSPLSIHSTLYSSNQTLHNSLPKLDLDANELFDDGVEWEEAGMDGRKMSRTQDMELNLRSKLEKFQSFRRVQAAQ